ncbi:MAG: hypothetical protein A2W00_06665 [Candidatus Eisenbacteria bacterium RBG_16_71_46]|nr:MAG: hypothetical protein A2W00_06665 [Candidatus Eisenbacteria bacterium RBG_16_71_46]
MVQGHGAPRFSGPGAPVSKGGRRGASPPRPPAPAPPPPLLPPLAEVLDPRGPFLVPLLLLLVTRLALWALVPNASEDAYITFRYARNFAAGHGLVYNPGEHVFGFSSPLWTLWSALGIRLTGEPVAWVRATSLAGDLVTLLMMGALLARHASAAAAWCFTYFFAAWPYFAAVAVSGMENGGMLSLIVLGAVLAGRRSPLAGPALAALALLRPEGLAAAVVLALGAGWRARVTAAALTVVGLIALAAYFGGIVPQSVIAKSSLYGTPGPWAGRHWWDWLSPVALGRAPTLLEGVHLFVMSVVFAPAVVVGALAVWRARRTPLALAIAACLVVWLGYSVLGVAYFYWYLVVPLGGLAALAAVGLPRIVRGPAIYVALALFVPGMWSIGYSLYLGRAFNEASDFGGAARYLARHARPGETVMLEPIGLVGFTAPLRVIDEIGLVTPRVAARRRAGSGWYADIALSERPEWLVVRRGVLREGAAFAGAGAPFRSGAERDSLLAHYRVEDAVGGSAGDQQLLIMRRAR